GGGGTQRHTVNISPGEAIARFLIRVLAVTPRSKQAEVNKTTPLNIVGDLKKEKPKLSCIPSIKSKEFCCSWKDPKNEQLKHKKRIDKLYINTFGKRGT
ncbi:hypothetical protein AVEN_70392-1, partial [Araneus ventricosus]